MGAKHVVIVGCGFGGLECAKRLQGTEVDVTLVDRNNYHLFTPLLYQVATALLNPSDIGYPIRKIFRGSANIRFRRAEVTTVDFDARVVHTSVGADIAYDELVLATGSTTNYFGNESLANGALGLKNLEEALQLRNHILGCLEEASIAAEAGDTGALAEWATFVIVGGGPTGVEFAGAVAELFSLVLGAEYPAIPAGAARIVLIEGSDGLLGAFDPKLGAYAAATLEGRGVDVVLGTLVTEAADDHLILSDGTEVPTRTLVWSAGVRPEDPAADGVDRSRTRRIEVDETLSVKGRNGVHAIGDAASVCEDGHELPMLGPPAMQAGRYVADRILGRPGSERPFRYHDKGTMATIGRSAAVAQIGSKIRLTGFLGWLAWLVLHLYYLIGFHNRLRVLLAWGWNYFHGDRPIRIITRAKAERIHPAD